MNSSGYLYGAAESGQVWIAASDPAQVGPSWIGNTVFNTETPILVYRNPVGSGVRATISSAILFINNTPGGPVSLRVMSDRIDRYVTLTGTLHTNGNANQGLTLPATVGGAARTSALQVYDELVEYENASFTNSLTYNGIAYSITSSAGDTDGGVVAATAGSFLDLNFRGSFILDPGRTAAIYAWAATTEPRGRFVTRWTEKKLNFD